MRDPDFTSLTGAVRRAKAEGYQLSYGSLRQYVAAGYIPHVPQGRRVFVFYPNVIKFLQAGLTPEQSREYQMNRRRS